jgi:hypothetical protein
LDTSVAGEGAVFSMSQSAESSAAVTRGASVTYSMDTIRESFDARDALTCAVLLFEYWGRFLAFIHGEITLGKLNASKHEKRA